MNRSQALFPCLHHCKEGWPSDKKNGAKHPLLARTGWFSDENKRKRKTTPAASASLLAARYRACAARVATRKFIDEAASAPCGDARRGTAVRLKLIPTCFTCFGFPSRRDLQLAIAVLAALVFPIPALAQTDADLFDPDKLQEIRLELHPADWALL